MKAVCLEEFVKLLINIPTHFLCLYVYWLQLGRLFGRFDFCNCVVCGKDPVTHENSSSLLNMCYFLNFADEEMEIFLAGWDTEATQQVWQTLTWNLSGSQTIFLPSFPSQNKAFLSCKPPLSRLASVEATSRSLRNALGVIFKASWGHPAGWKRTRFQSKQDRESHWGNLKCNLGAHVSVSPFSSLNSHVWLGLYLDTFLKLKKKKIEMFDFLTHTWIYLILHQGHLCLFRLATSLLGNVAKFSLTTSRG